MGKFKNNIVIKLLGAIIIGILLGSIVGEGPIQVIATIKHITGQFIFFCVPLVIIGTIASSITNLKEIVDFAIPIGSTIHLCGSVLTEVFFVMTISQILYETIPSVGTMIIFIILLGVFAVGAPGVPGGTVMASLGIVTSILLFDDAGVALLISVFALQDSFGTACNITGDGAIALMLTGLFKKEKRAVS